MKIKTFDVTGFGGGYEATTQRMIWNGVRFLVANQMQLQPQYKEYENIYGITIPEGQDAEDLDKAIMAGIDDATGAMHQCTVVVGAHPNGEPLGEPGDDETKALRTQAHREAEKIWGEWKKIGGKQKAKMYDWLEKNTKSGHFGKMSKEELRETIQKLVDLQWNQAENQCKD